MKYKQSVWCLLKDPLEMLGLSSKEIDSEQSVDGRRQDALRKWSVLIGYAEGRDVNLDDSLLDELDVYDAAIRQYVIGVLLDMGMRNSNYRNMVEVEALNAKVIEKIKEGFQGGMEGGVESVRILGLWESFVEELDAEKGSVVDIVAVEGELIADIRDNYRGMLRDALVAGGVATPFGIVIAMIGGELWCAPAVIAASALASVGIAALRRVRSYDYLHLVTYVDDVKRDLRGVAGDMGPAVETAIEFAKGHTAEEIAVYLHDSGLLRSADVKAAVRRTIAADIEKLSALNELLVVLSGPRVDFYTELPEAIRDRDDDTLYAFLSMLSTDEQIATLSFFETRYRDDLSMVGELKRRYGVTSDDVNRLIMNLDAAAPEDIPADDLREALSMMLATAREPAGSFNPETLKAGDVLVVSENSDRPIDFFFIADNIKEDGMISLRTADGVRLYESYNYLTYLTMMNRARFFDIENVPVAYQFLLRDVIFRFGNGIETRDINESYIDDGLGQVPELRGPGVADEGRQDADLVGGDFTDSEKMNAEGVDISQLAEPKASDYGLNPDYDHPLVKEIEIAMPYVTKAGPAAEEDMLPIGIQKRIWQTVNLFHGEKINIISSKNEIGLTET
ncbi:MAG: hypothetical protein PHO97_03275, partial [Synergistaceae bacterium]|nr:hypothetical protein [Synergistaceae bacterium]